MLIISMIRKWTSCKISKVMLYDTAKIHFIQPCPMSWGTIGQLPWNANSINLCWTPQSLQSNHMFFSPLSWYVHKSTFFLKTVLSSKTSWFICDKVATWCDISLMHIDDLSPSINMLLTLVATQLLFRTKLHVSLTDIFGLKFFFGFSNCYQII